MKKILFLAILIILGCNNQADHRIVQNEDHWIILDFEDAMEKDDKLSWNFEIHCRGSYNVQILSKGELAAALPEMSLESAGSLVKEAPAKISVIDIDGKKYSISQFNNSLTFSEAGSYSLEIDTDPEIHMIRIIPHYRLHLGFSSGRYDQQWLEMHTSREKQAAMARLKENKYGMFIHWGIYSQAGGIWKDMRIEDSPHPGPHVAEWMMSTFQISREEYATLADTFNPDKSFAETIARLAVDAGMKYVIITSKHHDGFALFDSECSDYDIIDRSPYKSDAIKELYDACINQGLDFGVYYSHGNDWFDGTDGDYGNIKKRNDSLGIMTHMQGKNHWDPSPNTFIEYLETKAYPQVKELLELMPELSLIWFDGDGNLTEDQAFRFYKTIFDINPNVIVNRRIGFDFGDYLDAGDNMIPSVSDTLLKYWETCGTTNNSWGFKEYDDDWKSTHELLYYLIDIASKGGNYLLNIGPDGKGHVPEASAQGLREMGQWLKVNGDAIYGTTRWRIPFEGQDETLLEGTGQREAKGFKRTFSKQDFWFTAKNNKVYAISLVPAQDTIKIRSLRKDIGNINDIRLLGSNQDFSWKQTESELQINLSGLTTGNFGYALELTF